MLNTMTLSCTHNEKSQNANTHSSNNPNCDFISIN